MWKKFHTSEIFFVYKRHSVCLSSFHHPKSSNCVIFLKITFLFLGLTRIPGIIFKYALVNIQKESYVAIDTHILFLSWIYRMVQSVLTVYVNMLSFWIQFFLKLMYQLFQDLLFEFVQWTCIVSGWEQEKDISSLFPARKTLVSGLDNSTKGVYPLSQSQKCSV